MKNEKCGSFINISPSNLNINKNKDNNKIDLEKNNNLLKDIKTNNNIKTNENSSPQFSDFKENINQEESPNIDLDNFNIAFFLPKELEEKIEEKEAVCTEKELKCSKEEYNSNNITDIENKNVNEFNNHLNNLIINDKSYLNMGMKENSLQNINNLPNICDLNINIENKKKSNEIEKNVNNFSMKNIENINLEKFNIPPQINNNLPFDFCNLNKLNNNYNLNNNLLNTEKNIFHQKNDNFTNGINNTYNQIKEQLNYIPFNNKNINNFQQNNQNIIFGNQFLNNPLFLNGNNYINPINQINFNFNQFNTLNNNMTTFNYNNNNHDAKKRNKKYIDDYTIEMFGRRGWICLKCNNFNYETRKKCNRCHINKMAKKIIKNNFMPDENKNINHKNDWHCNNCGNFNYSFRVICNRCQMKKFE